MNIIASITRNNGIGCNGNLLERIPADLERFKALTTGNIVVMGRKTFESLPGGPLPNRVNVVLTSDEDFRAENVLVVYYLEQLMGLLRLFKSEKIFIIGGGQLYKEMIDHCDTMYITYIDKDYPQADTFFPRIDRVVWDLVTWSEEYDKETGIEFTYKTYERKK